MRLPNWVRWVIYRAFRHIIWRNVRPKRMHRLGRPVFTVAQTEALYFRCGSDTVAGRRLLPAKISPTGQSVNRSKCGPYFDVILPSANSATDFWIYLGVARVSVSSIPTTISNPAVPKPVDYQVDHRPDDDNYGHCEINAYRAGKPVTPSAQLIKKELRQTIADKSVVILQPNRNVARASPLAPSGFHSRVS